jgi:hypothetical protein
MLESHGGLEHGRELIKRAQEAAREMKVPLYVIGGASGAERHTEDWTSLPDPKRDENSPDPA